MPRLFFVGGNWKMNGNKDSIQKLLKEVNEGKKPSKEMAQIVVAPPALYLDYVHSRVEKDIEVAAQNCYFESKGAFTGEISGDMIKDLGLSWVILGHSERRDIFKENDALIAKKTVAALALGLQVILCIGEHLEERESKKTEEVLSVQLKAVADVVKDWSKIVIAYEPVWAIGTGKTATPEIAQDTHKFIRQWMHQHVGSETADRIRIIYGGSVKGSNSADLAKQADIDGFLVGGASLVGQEFLTIVNSVEAKVPSKL